MSTSKRKPVKADHYTKELVRISKLFKDLDSDKSLPTFGEHYLHCLITGCIESANLKAMYPRLYKKLSEWLVEHNKRVTL